LILAKHLKRLVAGSPDDESGGRKENEQNNPGDYSDVFLILRGAMLLFMGCCH
jgi:hypothetical protein